MSLIPIISAEKSYWLFRTNGGKYYHDFRRGGYIAINWDTITLEEIEQLTDDELTVRVKQDYPRIQKPVRTANQLRIFANHIKAGDTVIITGHGSHVVSIGEVDDTTPFEVVPVVDEFGQPVGCPYVKRKKVRWLREIDRLDLGKKLIRFVQRPQHTISSADDYAEEIESATHDFFIKGDRAHLTLQVRKEGVIPASAFFSMGSEIINLVREFNEYSTTFKFNIDEIEAQININSKGRLKLAGGVTIIMLLGLILMGLTGGKANIKFPIVGGSIQIETGSLVEQINNFLDSRQQRQERDLLIKMYMDQLEVETPEELGLLLDKTSTK